MWQFITSTFDHLALFVSTAIFRTASIVLLFVYLPWGVAIGWPAFFLANLMCGYQRYFSNILLFGLIWLDEISSLEYFKEVMKRAVLFFRLQTDNVPLWLITYISLFFPACFPSHIIEKRYKLSRYFWKSIYIYHHI